MAHESTPKLDRPAIGLIGAFNIDVNVKGKIPPVLLNLFAEEEFDFHYFGENYISDNLAKKITDRLPNLLVENELGGSVFHAACGLRHYSTDITIKPIGSVGMQEGGSGHLSEMSEFGFDNLWLKQGKLPSALSFSFEHDGARTTFTSLGSNKGTGQLLVEHNQELLEYLKTVKVLHVCSFLDVGTQQQLQTFLQNLLKIEPAVSISFDPGSEWARNTDHLLTDIIGSSSILHLKESAFKLIGGRLRREGECAVAHRIMHSMRDGVKKLLVRGESGISLFTSADNEQPLKIEVPLVGFSSDVNTPFRTGSGYVFGGLFLGGLVSPFYSSALSAKHAAHILSYPTNSMSSSTAIGFEEASAEFIGQPEIVDEHCKIISYPIERTGRKNGDVL